MIQGLILAGGYASRMETNKMILPYEGKILIQHVIDSMLPFVDSIIIVTGFYYDDIVNAVHQNKKIEYVRNYNYELGMFSSVLSGASIAKGDLLIIPGDYPSIKPSTYQMLLEAKGLVRVPVCDSRRGHPLYLEHSVVEELKKEPIESNLKVFRNRHQVTEVYVDDAGTLLDIDTVLEYQTLINNRKENK